MPTETANALRQHGVKTVTLIGGTNAITTTVENALKATPAADCNGNPLIPAANLVVSRISGPDRYATAKNVAEFPGLAAGGTAEPGLDAATLPDCGTAVKTAIVASGENFPDALAAGPLAASGMAGTCPGTGGPLPLILTPRGAVDASTSAALIDMNVKQVILMGGTSAVSSGVATSIGALNSGINVVRVSGPTRQATAASLAAIEASPLLGGFNGTSVAVSRPDAAPDALAIGPAAGLTESPLLLTASTTSLGTDAHDVIVAWAGTGKPLVDAIVVGGTSALADSVVTDLKGALAAQTP